jgi:hypothetical protein
MRIALSIALFLAILCQAFIPAGFMPGAGAATMVICSGMDRKTITVDQDGQPVEEKQQSGCAFAPVLAFSGVTPPALGLPLAIELNSAIIPPVMPRRPAGFYHSAQPQGPPAFV